MRAIPESDWKKLRAIKKTLLNRVCTQILKEVACQIDSPKKQAYDTYLELYELIQKRDEKVAELFDDWRRSTVYFKLMAWCREGLLTQEEFEQLSEDTKNVTREIVEITFFEK